MKFPWCISINYIKIDEIFIVFTDLNVFRVSNEIVRFVKEGSFQNIEHVCDRFIWVFESLQKNLFICSISYLARMQKFVNHDCSPGLLLQAAANRITGIHALYIYNTIHRRWFCHAQYSCTTICCSLHIPAVNSFPEHNRPRNLQNLPSRLNGSKK